MTTYRWENRGMWPQAVKVVICFAAAATVFFMMDRVWISPLIQTYENRIHEWEAILAVFSKKHDAALQLSIHRQKTTGLQLEFDELLKKWPKKKDIPMLLETISTIGSQLGLTLESLIPENEIQTSFYIELPIQLIVTGAYQQIVLFLKQISQLESVITVHDFTIKGKDEGTPDDRLVMKVMMKLYRYAS